MQHVYEMAEKDLGLWEWKEGHNPKILDYFAEVGHAWVKDDETAWCAAFVGAMLGRAGLTHTGKLNARSYLSWGEPVATVDAECGDVVVFSRGDPNGWQGHVAFFHGFATDGDLLVLGGNQANQVNIKKYSASRLLGVRRVEQEAPPAPPAAEIPAPSGLLAAFLSFLGSFRK